MRDWGGFPSFFFSFFFSLNARLGVQHSLLLALAPPERDTHNSLHPAGSSTAPHVPLAVGTALPGLTVGTEGRSQCVGLKVTVGRAEGSQCK